MTVRQCTRAAELLANALRLNVSATTWDALPPRVRDASLADQLQQIGPTLGLTYLTRTVDLAAVERAARERDYPVVFLASPTDRNGDILVLADFTPGRVRLTRVSASGESVVLDASTPESIAREVGRLVGSTPFALSPTAVSLLTARDVGAVDDVEDDSAAEAEATAHVSSAVARLWELLNKDKREILVVFF